MNETPLIAVFIDFENLAYGVKDMGQADFHIDLVLKRLLEKGRIVHKRAYCDWSRFRNAVREFHTQGIELIDIPQTRVSGKNSADIRMVVDALDLCYSKGHIDAFALISGDSDFSPLVHKLKENDKQVIGCGVKASTSDLLIASCDEFIYYDDLFKASQKPRRRSRTDRSKKADPGKATDPQATTKAEESKTEAAKADDPREEAVDRLMEITLSLVQEYEPLWGSLVKQTIRRVYPGFSEAHYGYENFTELLKDAEKQGLFDLEYDASRGNYKIRLE